MSSVIKPQPEYSAPPVPEHVGTPGSGKQPGTSYRWVWIILSILALMSIIGGAFLALGVGFAVKTVGGPSIATDQYYSAIKNQDYARAYTYLGGHLKTELSKQAFTQAAQQQDTTGGRVSRFAFTNVPLGDPATLAVTVTRTNGTSYTVHLELRQEGGVWKITAFDRI